MDELKSAPVPLGAKTLGRLHADIAVPRYDRAALSPGVVHVGVGNFHRAHLAGYLDDLMVRGLACDFAIIGAGVTGADAQMRARLQPQDWLYTTIERGPDVARARVIGAMTDFLPVEAQGAIAAAIAAPGTRIVSLTITEGGYFLGRDGHVDGNHADLLAERPGQAARTVFGHIVDGLVRRRAERHGALTILSCDNLPHNGVVTREAVLATARIRAPELVSWIRDEVAFPNGMVDRIAIAVGAAERAWVAEAFGIDDAAPVLCEPFRQWVLEDRFAAGRPPLEEVGVTFAADVTPFETMKIRILNGGHALIAYPAGLMSVEYAHEAMAHPLIAAFLDRVERHEILPLVPAVPGIDLPSYLDTIAARFANPGVRDTIRRLCLDGSNRQPKFIVPSLRDALAAGRPFEGLALESALWCRYCRGETEAGTAIPANDPVWGALVAAARAAERDPRAWLAQGDVYGDLAGHAAFARQFAIWLAMLAEKGVERTLQAYLEAPVL